MKTLTATTFRNIIGNLELNQNLTSRDVVNTKMRAILDDAADPWGIKANRVELKNILPPADVQSYMEKIAGGRAAKIIIPSELPELPPVWTALPAGQY